MQSCRAPPGYAPVLVNKLLGREITHVMGHQTAGLRLL